eukprot:jgi/Botrbrau1/18592/Bobra.0367s0034.1
MGQPIVDSMLIVALFLALSSTIVTAVSPADEELDTFCSEREYGPYIDKAEPRCFIFCHRQNEQGEDAEVVPPSYRSCCEAGKCFTLPSTSYPLGSCGSCSHRGSQRKRESVSDTIKGKSKRASVANRYAPVGKGSPGVDSFAGAPLTHPQRSPSSQGGGSIAGDQRHSRASATAPISVNVHNAAARAPAQGPALAPNPSPRGPMEVRRVAPVSSPSRGTPTDSSDDDESLDDLPEEAAGDQPVPPPAVSRSKDRKAAKAPLSQHVDPLWDQLMAAAKRLAPSEQTPGPSPQETWLPGPAPGPGPFPFHIPLLTEPFKDTPDLPIMSVEEFSDLTEKQLFDIFTQGVPDIPSALPGERGKFAICNRTNVMIPNSIGTRPWGLGNVTIPYGDEIFNMVQQIWMGKVMYTDPSDGKTTLWNLLLDDETVDILASVSSDNPGISQDGKPSVVINYGVSDIPVARIIRDEMRRVGPDTWLGRAFFVNPVVAALPTSEQSQPFVKALEPFTNLTTEYINFLGEVANATAAFWITTPPAGFLPITLYFSCECQSYYAPKLHYFPLLAEPLTAIQRVTGYQDPLYTLPSLTGPAEVDPNAAVLEQEPESSDVNPFVLWPYNLDNPSVDGLDGLRGFLQLPAHMFTRIFGSSWLPNLPIRGGWNPELAPRSEGLRKGQLAVADAIIYEREPAKIAPQS